MTEKRMMTKQRVVRIGSLFSLSSTPMYNGAVSERQAVGGSGPTTNTSQDVSTPRIQANMEVEEHGCV